MEGCRIIFYEPNDINLPIWLMRQIGPRSSASDGVGILQVYKQEKSVVLVNNKKKTVENYDSM